MLFYKLNIRTSYKRNVIKTYSEVLSYLRFEISKIYYFSTWITKGKKNKEINLNNFIDFSSNVFAKDN